LFNWAARPINCALGAESGNAQYGYQQPMNYNQGYGSGMQQQTPSTNCSKDGSGNPSAYQGGQNNVAFNQPPAAQASLGASDLQRLSSLPVVAFQVLKYAGKDINVPPLATLNLGTGNDLRFDIRTGEHFAIKVDTSVPGRIQLVNTDVDGKVENLGTYEVVGNSENRIPRGVNIEMLGRSGNETLDVMYQACISSALANDPRVSPFKPYLPACSEDVAVKQLASVNMKRYVGGKGMGNSEYSPSSTTALMASSEAVAKGGAMSFRIYVNHQPSFAGGATSQGGVPGL
jgi:hypothetical protein